MTGTEARITGPIPASFAISSFAKPARTNTRPTRQEVSWPRFCELFSHHLRVEHKDDAGWSPATYRPGTTRANTNVQAVAMAVWDKDHRTAGDLDRDRARLADLDLAHLIHSSYSHTPSDYRYRIVVPLTHPVIAGEHWVTVWSRAWWNYSALLGGNDAQTKDMSRMFYQSAAPPDGEVFAFVGEGQALNWEALPDAPNAPTDAPAVDGEHAHGAVNHLGYETLRFIALGAAKDQRWHALGAARALLASGYSEEGAAALVWRGLDICRQTKPEPWTYEDALAIVEDLARRPASPLKPLNHPKLIISTSGRLPCPERTAGVSLTEMLQGAQR